MQDVTASAPNGVSGQNLNVQSVNNITGFDFKLAYADFHTNDRNKDINVETSSTGSDAAVGSTASGMPPVEIDDYGITNFIDHMQEIALNLQALTQTPDMSKKRGPRTTQKTETAQELQ